MSGDETLGLSPEQVAERDRRVRVHEEAAEVADPTRCRGCGALPADEHEPDCPVYRATLRRDVRHERNLGNDDLSTASAPAPGSRWEFDHEVTQAFDDMLERSIPNYGQMRQMVARAADWFLDRATHAGRQPTLVDLGASRGTQVAPLVDTWGARARFYLVDQSEPMLDVMRERYDGMMNAGIVTVAPWDLREGFPHASGRPAVVLSVLTLQFVPIEYRQRLLREAHEALLPGGALILVEKVLGSAEETNRLLVDLYYGLKRENGYTQEAVDRKRLALEGVLVPLTAQFDEELVRGAGFATVDVVWAWANFRAWVAVKR